MPRVTVTACLFAFVLALAVLLRVDAITETYGPVASPGWLRWVQEAVRQPASWLTPATIGWEPAPDWPHRDGPPTKYASDPHTYLGFAREMTSFYGAHYREPLFPFATRLWLRALNDQDVAVSFASAMFSVLAIAGVFLLGRHAGSPAVGLAAAAGLAIEYDVIAWGIGGWRDDAFMFGVVACAMALVRLLKSGRPADAVLLGIAGGFACLVRVTSLSFLVPGSVVVALSMPGTPRRRLQMTALAAVTSALIAGPYLFNCWRTFGDPLYAINYHTSNYLAAEGLPDAQTSAASYVEARLANRPFRTMDTIAVGMTAYPFENKWTGFDRWLPGLGGALAALALIGLPLWLASPAGRLLLIVLFASLVPYAVTWQLAADWRFTAHAYPFYLLAAATAAAAIVRSASPARLRAAVVPARRAVATWGPPVVVVVLAGLTAWRVLPVLSLQEALAAGDDVSVMAGGREAALYGRGWSAPFTEGNVTARAADVSPADIWLPLPRAERYQLSLRMNPFPRPVAGETPRLPVVRVAVNGQHLADVPLSWDPDRVGAYELTLPETMVTPGLNRLSIAAANERGIPGLSVWYVRVRQPVPADAR